MSLHDGDYKVAKEAFVADNAGDTLWRIDSVCLTALSTYQLWQNALPLLSTRLRRGWLLVCAEYILLVLPLLCALTIFSDHPLWFNLAMYMGVGFCQLVKRSRASPSFQEALQARHSRADGTEGGPGREEEKEQASRHGPTVAVIAHRPFVTVWRAHMMLMTIICILAVDFPVFPRSFGKCETWGTSLMDLGVGSFVFSLGLASASPFLQKPSSQRSTTSLPEALRRSAAVLALGMIRIISVKGTEYPEHVSEYGVHWNFFFTLGLLPLCGAIAERFWERLTFRSMALLVTFAHQALLVFTPLQAYTLNAQRTNVLAANKEGVVSFAGYLAIYLLGFDTGVYTLPINPDFAYRKVAKGKDQEAHAIKPKVGKLMNLLFSYASVWSAALAVIIFLLPDSFKVSRRLANTGYVFWVAAFNVAFLFLYLVAYEGHGSGASTPPSAPAILQALNKNGLVVFLVANLLTGAVNLSVQTMYASDARAMTILIAYTFSVVCIAWAMRGYRLKL